MVRRVPSKDGADDRAQPRTESTTGSRWPTGPTSTPNPVVTIESSVPANSDSRRVIVGYQQTEGSLTPRPIGSTVYEATRGGIRELEALRVNNPDGYRNAVNMLRATGLLGERATSWESIKKAYGDLVEVAASAFSGPGGKPITIEAAAEMLIKGSGAGAQSAGTSGLGGGRAAAYTGPVESVTVQAETDIIATAQATARALLGRTATEEEIQKILKQTRKAEQGQPTVQTRQGPGRVTTEEGLTKEGRDAILKKVLMASPDYAGFQIDSTAMDMMSNILRRGQEVARG